ncbi:MAG: hypothetical protein HQL42_13205 [Alphaproteobacteria bacterium]|nr:hypothetical protein [Alphaproteobacteria bacterium]
MQTFTPADSAATSIAAAFPDANLTPRQYQVVAELWAGADIRAHTFDWRIVQTLEDKGVVLCEATTNRLLLMTSEATAARLRYIKRRIADLSEVDDWLERNERRAQAALTAAVADVSAQQAIIDQMIDRLAFDPKAHANLASARLALALAQDHHLEMRRARQRAAEQRGGLAPELDDLRHEAQALERTIARRERRSPEAEVV